MFWPFKRKQKSPEELAREQAEADLYDKAAANLIAQGVPPEKVMRATRLIKRYAKEGVLPDGLVDTDKG